MALICLALSGCAHAGYYPVCVLPSQTLPAELLWLRSEKLVGSVLATGLHGGGSYSRLSSSGVLVRTNGARHAELRLIWPSVGCVGSSDTLGDDARLRSCQADMKTYFEKRLGTWPGSAGDVHSECVRVEQSAWPLVQPGS